MMSEEVLIMWWVYVLIFILQCNVKPFYQDLGHSVGLDYVFLASKQVWISFEYPSKIRVRVRVILINILLTNESAIADEESDSGAKPGRKCIKTSKRYAYI